MDDIVNSIGRSILEYLNMLDDNTIKDVEKHYQKGWVFSILLMDFINGPYYELIRKEIRHSEKPRNYYCSIIV